MKHDFRFWVGFSSKDDLGLAHAIDNAVKTIDDYKPDFSHIAALGDSEKPMRVLDFGCGMGRYLVGMLEYSPKWIVWGYDQLLMLERAKKFYGDKLNYNDRLFLTDSWDMIVEQAKSKRGKFFDVIFSSLVFQHIEPDELRGYLADMQKMTSRLYVLNRRANDIGWKNDSDFIDTWKIIMEFFQPVDLEPGLLEGKSPHDHHFGLFKPI